MKKLTALVSVLSLSTIFALTTLNVFAESGENESERQNQNEVQIRGATHLRLGQNDKQDHEGDRESKTQGSQDDRSQWESDGDNKNDDEGEVSLHEYASKSTDIKVAVVLPEVNSTTTSTYADVVSVLMQYQNAIKLITAKATLSDVSSSLSVQERAVLGKLLHKHGNDFNLLTSRSDDLSLQIKDLIEALTPLGSATITTSFNVKSLIISQLKDFAGAINDLKDLGDTNVDIINQETN